MKLVYNIDIVFNKKNQFRFNWFFLYMYRSDLKTKFIMDHSYDKTCGIFRRRYECRKWN